MKKQIKKILSLILALTMAVGLIPAAFAETAAGAEPMTGTAEYYSTDAKKNVTGDYTYSDAWFFADPEERNDELALVSMQLAAAATDEATGKAFLSALGFGNTGAANYATENPTDCAYTWGTKSVSDGSSNATVVAIVFQSYAEDMVTKVKGWLQNMTVNGPAPEGEHFSYALAVNQIVSQVSALAGSGEVKFWITGFSRGGALANLLAQRLYAAGDVFAYTFESPATAAGGTANDYPSIHNYICLDDPVISIPPWGMIRYGEDFVLYDKADETLQKLLAGLVAGIPTRADYSIDRTDMVSMEGIPFDIPVLYNYQTVLGKLAAFIASNAGSLDGDTDLISEVTKSDLDLNTVVDYVQQLAENTTGARYKVTMALYALLSASFGENGDLPLTADDLYGLLTLLVPICIDPAYELDPALLPFIDEETLPVMKLIGYLSPLFALTEAVDTVKRSHSFDTEISRLKELIYGPAVKRIVDHVELTYRFPRAGESVDEDTWPAVPEDALYHVYHCVVCREDEDGWEGVYDNLPAEELTLRVELSTNEPDILFLCEDWTYLGTVSVNGEPVDADCISLEHLIDPDEGNRDFLIIEIPFTPEEGGSGRDGWDGWPFPMPAGSVTGKTPIRFPIRLNTGADVGSKASETVSEAAKPEDLPGQTPAAPAAPAVTEPAAAETPALPFADVTAASPYLTGIRYAAENGIMNGVSETEFDPDGTLTRAMFVTILGRMDKVDPADYTESSFTDVAPLGTWDYTPYVEWAAENGIVLGYGDGTFGPTDPVTNEQAVLMLQRYARYLGEEDDAIDAAVYPEGTTVSPWAADAVAWAYSNAIYPTETAAAPTAPAARGWMAQAICNFVGFLAD
ncbi:MAG: hypothetical protein E7576_11415 [Ruminococcaceae bacterium]|jgi:hypothetical protein|nr:hypothetical protein [Oscillospiraceae bacterium]